MGSPRDVSLFAPFFFVLLCGTCLGQNAGADPTHRRYELGPLAIKEFRGKQDDRTRLSAYTATRISCHSQYDVRIQKHKAVVVLKSLDIYAVFLTHDSWWGKNATPQLLDHEQGHFDIAEINARRAKLAFAKRFSGGRTITTTGESEEVACRALFKVLDEFMQPIFKQNDQDNLDYDRSTGHGQNSRVQREQRRAQQLRLKQLAEELTELDSR